MLRSDLKRTVTLGYKIDMMLEKDKWVSIQSKLKRCTTMGWNMQQKIAHSLESWVFSQSKLSSGIKFTIILGMVSNLCRRTKHILRGGSPGACRKLDNGSGAQRAWALCPARHCEIESLFPTPCPRGVVVTGLASTRITFAVLECSNVYMEKISPAAPWSHQHDIVLLSVHFFVSIHDVLSIFVILSSCLPIFAFFSLHLVSFVLDNKLFLRLVFGVHVWMS